MPFLVFAILKCVKQHKVQPCVCIYLCWSCSLGLLCLMFILWSRLASGQEDLTLAFLSHPLVSFFFPPTHLWSVANCTHTFCTLALKSHPVVFCEAIIVYTLTVCNMTVEIIWQTCPDEHTVPFTPQGACHFLTCGVLAPDVSSWHHCKHMLPISVSFCVCVFVRVLLGSFNKLQCLLLPYCLCLFISNPMLGFSVS